MKECLENRKNCGTYDTEDPNNQPEFVEDEYEDAEFPDYHTACGAHYERLRFIPVMEERYIKKYDHDDSPNEKSFYQR